MRSAIAIALLALSASAVAQTCDMTLTTEVAYKGQPVGKSSITYVGLLASDVSDINKMGLRVVNTGSKHQDKGGGYTLVLGESHVCDGKQAQPQSVEFQGLKPSGMTTIFRAAAKESEQLMKAAEEQERKGKKRVWGKE